MKKYVSIVGFKYYCGKEPFVPGLMLQCVKEPYNPHDSDMSQTVYIQPLTGHTPPADCMTKWARAFWLR